MTMPFSPCDPAAGACTDVTVGILRRVFGPIIDTLVAGTDPNTVSASTNVLASMFATFNSGILIVGSLIVAYVAMMGTINTAHDGEAMGKAWSTVWTPVRIVGGGAVLLPSASGYSFIQHIVLMLALWGIGFANSIFKTGIQAGIIDGTMSTISAQAGYGSGSKPSESFPLYDVRKFAEQYLAISYCAYAANKIYDDPASSPAVSAGALPDVTTKEDTSGALASLTFLIKDRNPASNLGGGAPLCGTVKMYSYLSQPTLTVDDSDSPSAVLNSTSSQANQAALQAVRVAATNAKQAALVQLMKDIDAWVSTMPYSVTQPGWNNINSQTFNQIVDKAQQAVISNLGNQIANDTTLSSIMKGWVDSVGKDGWAMAGGFQQRLGGLREEMSKIYASSPGDATGPDYSVLPSDDRAQLLADSVDSITKTIIAKADAGAGAVSATPSSGDFSALVPSSLGGLNVDTLRSGFDSKMSRLVNWGMQNTTEIMVGTDTDVDAISRIKRVGDWLTALKATTLAVDATIKTSVTGLRAAAAAVGSVKLAGTGVDLSPLGTAIWDWVIQVIAPQLARMESWLGVLAFYFSTFLPSLPYAIFMIVVAGWVLAVVQSVVAAPLWAIMHMRPSQTFIGSDQQGYLLLLALFARPALAVIGLFAGILVADPLIAYIAKAFFAMRTAIVTSQESLGWIIEFMTFADWLIVFGLILLPVVYMCFGLPQILPDHVLKWIGAGVGDLGETHATNAMRGGIEQAAMRGQIPDAGTGGGMRRLPDGGTPPIPGGGPSRGGGSGGGSAAHPRAHLPVNIGGQGIAPAEVDGLDTSAYKPVHLPRTSHGSPDALPESGRTSSGPAAGLISGGQGVARNPDGLADTPLSAGHPSIDYTREV